MSCASIPAPSAGISSTLKAIGRAHRDPAPIPKSHLPQRGTANAPFCSRGNRPWPHLRSRRRPNGGRRRVRRLLPGNLDSGADGEVSQHLSRRAGPKPRRDFRGPQHRCDLHRRDPARPGRPRRPRDARRQRHDDRQAGRHSFSQLDEVRQAQAETGRIFSICFSERHTVPAAVKAGHLISEGAIGRVIQTIGIGPHKKGKVRPDWFWDVENFGGIIVDIASHQVDQFLYYTGSASARGRLRPGGQRRDARAPTVRGLWRLRPSVGQGHGLCPGGLADAGWARHLGDGRLTILGTEGYIELRKYIDIAGREGENHLFLVNQEGTSTSTAPTFRSSTSSNSPPTCETVPQRRCRRSMSSRSAACRSRRSRRPPHSHPTEEEHDQASIAPR